MSALTLNQAADGWMVWVSGVILQASVVALIALAIVRCSRHLPANLKYVLLLMAMVKFVTPPFAGLPVGVFSQFTSPTAALDADTSDHIQPLGLPVAEIDVRKSNSEGGELAETNQTASIVSREASESSTPVQVTTEAVTVTRTSSTAVTARSLLPQLNMAAWLMLCWLIGAVVLMLRMVQGSNGVVHGNLRDFCDRSQRRMKHPPGHRHQFENLGTSLVFPRFNAVRTLTDDGARALLLS